MTSQSRPGFCTEATTLACAARWKIALGSTSSVERREPVDVDDVEHAQLGLGGDAIPVAGGEVVDDGHRIALAEQRIDDVRADESGSAGDDRALHGA